MRRRVSNNPTRNLALSIVLVFLAICNTACSSGSQPASDSPVISSEGGTVFGDELALVGHSESTRDGHSEVELRWKALRKPNADYNVFIHALGGSTGIAFQLDHPLKNSAGAPTGSWATGESVSDRFLAVPPPGQVPGAYTLRLGVNVVRPMKLLPVVRAILPEPKDTAFKGWAVLLEHVDCR